MNQGWTENKAQLSIQHMALHFSEKSAKLTAMPECCYEMDSRDALKLFYN